MMVERAKHIGAGASCPGLSRLRRDAWLPAEQAEVRPLCRDRVRHRRQSSPRIGLDLHAERVDQPCMERQGTDRIDSVDELLRVVTFRQGLPRGVGDERIDVQFVRGSQQRAFEGVPSLAIGAAGDPCEVIVCEPVAPGRRGAVRPHVCRSRQPCRPHHEQRTMADGQLTVTVDLVAPDSAREVTGTIALSKEQS